MTVCADGLTLGILFLGRAHRWFNHRKGAVEGYFGLRENPYFLSVERVLRNDCLVQGRAHRSCDSREGA